MTDSLQGFYGMGIIESEKVGHVEITMPYFRVLSKYDSISDFFQSNLRPILNGFGILPFFIHSVSVRFVIKNFSIISSLLYKSFSLMFFSLDTTMRNVTEIKRNKKIKNALTRSK